MSDSLRSWCVHDRDLLPCPLSTGSGLAREALDPRTVNVPSTSGQVSQASRPGTPAIRGGRRGSSGWWRPGTSSSGATRSRSSSVQPPACSIVVFGRGSVRSDTRSPNTRNVHPLTPAAASVHSHTTNGAILAGAITSAGACSLGRPMVASMSGRHGAECSLYSCTCSVIASGRIALQRMPKRPTSIAAVRVRPIRPSLAVGVRAVRRVPEPRRRARVHDRAAAAARHVGDRLAHERVVALEVHVHGEVPLRFGVVPQVVVAPRGRVVHEDVDAAELVQRDLHDLGCAVPGRRGGGRGGGAARRRGSRRRRPRRRRRCASRGRRRPPRRPRGRGAARAPGRSRRPRRSRSPRVRRVVPCRRSRLSRAPLARW